MTERRGDTLLFHTPPVIAAQAAVGGKKESDGPLAAGFDELTTDNRLGQCSWEAAEKQLQLRAARQPPGAVYRHRGADEPDHLFAEGEHPGSGAFGRADRAGKGELK